MSLLIRGTPDPLRLRVADSASTTGGAKGGLSATSPGLVVSMIAANAAAGTHYTQAAGTLEGVTTIGTYEAPTAGSARFAAVDATGHPGLYEIHLPVAAYSLPDRNLVITASGAAGAAPSDLLVELVDSGFNPTDRAKADGVSNDVGTLLARLTDPRATNLDNLTGHVAQSGDNFPVAGANSTSLATLLARLTAARATNLDNLTGHVAQSGDNFPRLGPPNAGSIAADIAAVDALVNAVGAMVAGLNDVSQADILYSAMTEPAAYAAAGQEGSLAQLVYAIHQLQQTLHAIGTAPVVYRLDGITPAFGLVWDDATQPTRVSRAP